MKGETGMQTTKILLVEDDRLIIENLTEFLKGEGFEVQYAEGQEKAMRLLEEQEFDLILLDVTLAQGNGYSACTQIKSRYEIPIIFLTALDDEFSVVTGLEMGADDYISKPFRPRELVSRMRTVLRRTGRNQKMLSCQDIFVWIRSRELRQKRERKYFSRRWNTGCCLSFSSIGAW